MGEYAISTADGRQYRHSCESGNDGMRTAAREAVLEEPCLSRQINATAGSQFVDGVLDSRLRGNDGDFRLRGNDGHFARSALGLVSSFVP